MQTIETNTPLPGSAVKRKLLIGVVGTALLAAAVGAPQRAAAAGTSECDAVAGNVVQNCGFETGTFSGWTRSGNTGNAYVTSDAPFVDSGMYGAQLGPVGSDGDLSQNLTLTPGATYQLSFYLYSDGGTPNDFGASVTLSDGSHTFFQQSNIPAQGYTQHTYTFMVPSNATPATLTFNFRDNPGFLALDDVVVAPSSSGPNCTTDPTAPGCSTNATPELGSGELLATGLLPIGAVLLYRRRRARRAPQQ